MSYGGEADVGYATARGRDWPSVRQFSVFLENRLGMLMDLVRKFETSDNRIIALTVLDSIDCAIIRIVLANPERARETIELAKLPYIEGDLLVVELPDDKHPLATICKALLTAEINIHYAYPVMLNPKGRPALALHVDDHEMAMAALQKQGFTILTEKDLDGS